MEEEVEIAKERAKIEAYRFKVRLNYIIYLLDNISQNIDNPLYLKALQRELDELYKLLYDGKCRDYYLRTDKPIPINFLVRFILDKINW
ncbi:MAG: hypothetical protein J7L07_02845 [Candidatus Odinarchaeota archaeon]|nr:hypothetical protein [Candidatus Odinarchaeota archaeon]